MWNVKIKTWGYAEGSFKPVEVKATITREMEIGGVLRLLTKMFNHEATFEISREEEDAVESFN